MRFVSHSYGGDRSYILLLWRRRPPRPLEEYAICDCTAYYDISLSWTKGNFWRTACLGCILPIIGGRYWGRVNWYKKENRETKRRIRLLRRAAMWRRLRAWAMKENSERRK
jgi:hypothetical protein